MEVEEAIRGRRSVRRFREDGIPDDVIEYIVEMGNLAPSAGNLQARDFIVVKDRQVKERLCTAALGQRFVAEVPVVIVVCANYERVVDRYGQRGMELYALHDTGAAIQNMLLAVHAKGLGACWVGAFHEKEVVKILDLPEHQRPVALIPIGVPVEYPSPTRRLPLSEIMRMV